MVTSRVAAAGPVFSTRSVQAPSRSRGILLPLRPSSGVTPLSGPRSPYTWKPSAAAPAGGFTEKESFEPAGASAENSPCSPAPRVRVPKVFFGIFAVMRKAYFPEVPPEAVTTKEKIPPPGPARASRTRTPAPPGPGSL